MNINDISTQLLYTTVPIYAKNNNGSFSSGQDLFFQSWSKMIHRYRCS